MKNDHRYCLVHITDLRWLTPMQNGQGLMGIAAPNGTGVAQSNHRCRKKTLLRFATNYFSYSGAQTQQSSLKKCHVMHAFFERPLEIFF